VGIGNGRRGIVLGEVVVGGIAFVGRSRSIKHFCIVCRSANKPCWRDENARILDWRLIVRRNWRHRTGASIFFGILHILTFNGAVIRRYLVNATREKEVVKKITIFNDWTYEKDDNRLTPWATP
jgi:hypothetical protein